MLPNPLRCNGSQVDFGIIIHTDFFFFQSKDEILIYYKTRQIIEIRVPGRFHKANYLGKDMLLEIF